MSLGRKNDNTAAAPRAAVVVKPCRLRVLLCFYVCNFEISNVLNEFEFSLYAFASAHGATPCPDPRVRPNSKLV